MKKNVTMFVATIATIFNLSGCANNQPNPLVSVLSKCKTETNAINWSILDIPSYGLLGDSMASAAASKGNDGGFVKSVKQIINQGNKDIAVVCSSQIKLKAFIKRLYTQSKDNELSNINLCIVGSSYPNDIKNEELRVGVKAQWYK